VRLSSVFRPGAHGPPGPAFSSIRGVVFVLGKPTREDAASMNIVVLVKYIPDPNAPPKLNDDYTL
jgi:hypothetical protein